MSKNDYSTRFEQIIRSFPGGVSVWQVFNDFLSLSAASLANTIPTPEREMREKEYLSLINRYGTTEQGLFVELFSVFVLAMEENPKQDFLRTMYHRLNLHQKQKGQFFTPYHISEFMSKIQVDKSALTEEINRKGYISVSDPACGSGAMIIAFANAVREENINYQKYVYFEAQDIDRTAGLMCYLQLSILGCPAAVIIGDSLLKPGMHPDNDVFYTPFYYLNYWRFQSKGIIQEEISVQEKGMQITANMEYLEDTGGQMKFCLEELLKEAA